MMTDKTSTQPNCMVVKTPEELQASMAIRRVVFVEEQKVPADREVDGLDSAAKHFIAKIGDKTVATCRVRVMAGAAKVERVAVLKDYRGLGVGKILMKYILQELPKGGDIQKFKLSSQADAVNFYEKLGFKVHGDEYMDAGIPHYDMMKEL